MRIVSHSSHQGARKQMLEGYSGWVSGCLSLAEGQDGNVTFNQL